MRPHWTPNTTRWLVGVALLAVLASVGALVSQNSAHPSTVPVPSLSAQIRVHALGRLEPRGEIVVLAPPSGNDGARIENLLVEVGDAIAVDQVIATLDNHGRRQASLMEAEAKLGAARARLQQTKAGAKLGEIQAQEQAVALYAEQMLVTNREWERARKLFQQKALSTEELETKKWAYDRTALEHRRANQHLEALREVRPIDVDVVAAEVKAAEAAVALARANLSAAEVRARSAGRVLRIHSRPGEKIGEIGILDMGDVDRMQAVAEVFEGDIPKIQMGQPAEVKVDATGARLAGVVEQLGAMVARKTVLTNDPVSDTDARVLEVRIQLNPSDSQKILRLSNARVEVTIDVADKVAGG